MERKSELCKNCSLENSQRSRPGCRARKVEMAVGIWREGCKPCLGQGHLKLKELKVSRGELDLVAGWGEGEQVAEQGMEGRRRCPGQGRSHQTFQTNSCPYPLTHLALLSSSCLHHSLQLQFLTMPSQCLFAGKLRSIPEDVCQFTAGDSTCFFPSVWIKAFLLFLSMAMILKSFTKPHWLRGCHNNVVCQCEELSNNGQMFKPPPTLVWAAIVSAGGGTSDILVIPTESQVEPGW